MALVAVLLALDLLVFHRRDRAPSLARIGRLDAFLVCLWPWPLTALSGGGLGPETGHRVLHGLPRRIVVVDGQRLRVRGHLSLLRHPAEISISGIVLGNSGGDRHAPAVRGPGQRIDQAIRLGIASVRRVFGLYGIQTGLQTESEVHPEKNILLRLARRFFKVSKGDHRRTRPRLFCSGGRPIVLHAPVFGAPGGRKHRRAVCRGQRAGDLRHHQRYIYYLYLEYLRHSRS